LFTVSKINLLHQRTKQTALQTAAIDQPETELEYTAWKPVRCVLSSLTKITVIAEPLDVMAAGMEVPQKVPTIGASRSSPFKTRT